ncbi:hypothetical protein LN996_20330 [Arthrobacter sp. AK01]|uniref:hypothetical protein n=1 Tax=Arthrobacter sp. AK01 TaxID=2894084 RepID=UPI001E49019F|nr:hypothetical protein [Arthrobacter sp. AK01]MCD4853172.1 hypothetical protein [Arthrobacter sp. AK01]
MGETNPAAHVGHATAKLGVASMAQLAITYPFVGAAWIAAMLASPMIGTASGVLLAMIHLPIFAIALGVLLGLPLRLHARTPQWWMGNGRLYVMIAAAAAGLMISGYTRRVRLTGVIEGVPYDELTPDIGLVLCGCFVLTFLLVNASLPLRWSK